MSEIISGLLVSYKRPGGCRPQCPLLYFPSSAKGWWAQPCAFLQRSPSLPLFPSVYLILHSVISPSFQDLCRNASSLSRTAKETKGAQRSPSQPAMRTAGGPKEEHGGGLGGKRWDGRGKQGSKNRDSVKNHQLHLLCLPFS